MKKMVLLTVMAAIVGFMFAGLSEAREPNLPPRRDPNMSRFDPNMFRGRVVVSKDANGITAIRLENRRRGGFNIVLDEKGKELAALDGKFVEVIGKITIKDNEKWLTVENFKEMERPSMSRHRPGEPNNLPRRGGPRED